MTQENPLKPSLLTLILVVLVVIAAFFIGSLWTKVSYLEKGGAPAAKSSGTGTQAPPGGQPQDIYTPVKVETLSLEKVTDNEHIRGDKNAQLTWIEYSDLECPFCKRIHPDLQKMMDEYKGKIRWVYRHFPLNAIHPKAQKAAEAAECAGSLGGNDIFWKFVDKLFEGSPTSLGAEEMTKTAKSVGLNESQFKSCLDSGKFADKVGTELKAGEKAGVTGTPGNFLLDSKGNAWIIPGAMPYATIKQVIDKALAL